MDSAGILYKLIDNELVPQTINADIVVRNIYQKLVVLARDYKLCGFDSISFKYVIDKVFKYLVTFITEEEVIIIKIRRHQF